MIILFCSFDRIAFVSLWPWGKKILKRSKESSSVRYFVLSAGENARFSKKAWPACYALPCRVNPEEIQI